MINKEQAMKKYKWTKVFFCSAIIGFIITGLWYQFASVAESVHISIFTILLILSSAALGAGCVAFFFEHRMNLFGKRFDQAKRNHDTQWIDSIQGDELGAVSFVLKSLSMDVSGAVDEVAMHRARLYAILQNMDQGVIALNDEGEIFVVNDRAKTLLGFASLKKGDHLQGNTALMHLRAMIQALQPGEHQEKELKVFADENRLLQVYIAALPQRAAGGTLIVLSDITRMRKLETMRSSFVGNVTHELKTPLTSIASYVELLQRGMDDEGKRKQAYDVIAIETERLQTLINDTLILSEIEVMPEELDEDTYDVISVFDEVCVGMESLAEKYKIDIVREMPSELFVNGNPLRMKQLLQNLLENAIKYNKPNGTVTVKMRRDAQWFFLQVSDTGIGIAEEHQERLFERFYRVDEGRSREHGGTGLGLSIVKHIVTLYGGEITCESQEGLGTTFFVRLKV